MSDWARYYDHPISYEPYTTEFEHVRVLLEEVRRRWRGGRVLEAGVGTGYMSIWLTKHGLPAIGIDLNAEIVQRAKYTNAVLSGTSDFFAGDLRELGRVFPGETFDVIFSQGVLEHYDDETIRALVAAELDHARHVVISVPSRWYSIPCMGDERLMTVEDWLRILEPLGARVEDARYRGEQPGGREHVMLCLTGRRSAADEPRPPVLEDAVAPQLVWESHLLKPSGYASMARNILAGLDELGVDLVLREFQGHFPSNLDPASQLRVLQLMAKPVRPGAVLVHHMPPIGVYGENGYGNVRAAWPGMGRYIGSTMFETDRMPRSWGPAFDSMDEVWVPTRFQKTVFTASGADPSRIIVTPNGIDPRRFDPERVRPRPLARPTKFNFLSVFEFSSRKGWETLVRAFVDEFTRSDGVSLTLLVYALHYSPGKGQRKLEQVVHDFIREKLGRDPARAATINVCEQVVAPRDMPGVYAAYDAFVLPSRGEGWGMPILEAMAMGLPAAATRFGGTVEFLDDRNGFPIEVDRLVPVAPEMVWEIPHFEGNLWAEPSYASTRAALRAIAGDPARAREVGARARADVLERFTVRTAGAAARARLRQLFGAPCSRRAPLLAARPADAPAPRAGLQLAWAGDFSGHDRRARVNRELAAALEARGLRIDARPTGGAATPAGAGPDVLVTHAAEPPERDPSARRHVWFAASDLGGLPSGWAAAAARFDEVWVPSRATRRIFADAGIVASKVAVVEPGIDLARFTPDAPPLDLPVKRRFRFLALGFEPAREGIAKLLDLYGRSFGGAEDVALVLHFPAAGPAIDELTRLVRKHQQQGAPEIVLLDQPLEDRDLPGLYTACDALVAPFHAASYGLALREAQACGRPVIATGGGPGLDAFGETTGFPIPATRFHGEGRATAGRCSTLVPQPHVLERVLRWVFGHQDAARARGAAAARLARERFGRDDAAAAVCARVAALAGGAPAAAPEPIRLFVPAGARVPAVTGRPIVVAGPEPERGGFAVQLREELERCDDDLVAVATGSFEATGDAVGALAARLAAGGHAAVMETPGGALAVFRAGSLRGLGRLDPLFQGPAAVLESLRAARADGLEVHDATAAGVSFAPGSAELARDRAAVAALEGAERAVAQDDVEGALAALTEALRLKPDYPEALRQSGRLLRRLGCAREAIRSFECLVQVSPADAAAHREAGETLLEAGLPVEAEKCFLRARRLNHWDPAIHRGMAYARFDRKLFRDALTWMRGALRLDPANVEIAVDCAAILQAAGRPRDALAFLRSYQSLHPHPELDTLVRSLEQDPAGAAPVEGGSGPKRGLHVLLPTPS